MKKEYIVPEIEFIEVKADPILSSVLGSRPGDYDTDDSGWEEES